MGTSKWAQSLFAGINSAGARLFDTNDPDEACALAKPLFSEHQLQVLDPKTPLKAVLDYYPVRDCSLIRLNWQTAVQVDPGQLQDYYLLCIPLAGQVNYRYGQQDCVLTPGNMSIISTTEHFRFTASSHYDQFLLHIRKAALDRVWAQLGGDVGGNDSGHSIAFDSHIAEGSKAWRALSPNLQVIADIVRGQSPGAASAYLGERMEEMVIISLLLNQSHSQGGILAPAASSKPARQFDQARDFLLANLEQPVTLAEISQQLGINIRTLQWVFNKEAGMGPMQWLKEQRLFSVRCALQDENSASAAASITDVALQYHFNHLGEFSQAYKRQFGETPSQTRKRAFPGRGSGQ